MDLLWSASTTMRNSYITKKIEEWKSRCVLKN